MPIVLFRYYCPEKDELIATFQEEMRICMHVDSRRMWLFRERNF
jgi:hypothetical protein